MYLETRTGTVSVIMKGSILRDHKRRSCLLRPLNLAGTVVTADTLQTQRDHARFLVEEKNAHFILVTKKNQPSLYHQLKELPWRQVPTGHTENHHGHGRTDRRRSRS